MNEVKKTMNATKHTPGPWHTAGEQGVQIRSKRDQIAKVWTMRGNEWKSNARLLAAAPELLEALEQIVWKLERKEMVASCPERFEFAKIDINDAVIRLARAAIAKATGTASE